MDTKSCVIDLDTNHYEMYTTQGDNAVKDLVIELYTRVILNREIHNPNELQKFVSKRVEFLRKLPYCAEITDSEPRDMIEEVCDKLCVLANWGLPENFHRDWWL